jgi:hypothetical protein
MLDYICWVAAQMRETGFHGGPDRDPWSRRVQTAFRALLNPLVLGHGDPYPSDVPPPKNPGIWPDVPAALIPGMTLRHQLVVLEIIADQCRGHASVHARVEEASEWDRRVAAAFEALDHGQALPMPDTARTTPSKAVLDAAAAHEKAIREHAKRRSRQIRDMLKKKSSAKGAKKARKAHPAPKSSSRPKAAAGAKSKARRK